MICCDCEADLSNEDHFHTIGAPAQNICCKCAKKAGRTCRNKPDRETRGKSIYITREENT